MSRLALLGGVSLLNRSPSVQCSTHMAVRVEPVVVDLAAEDVATDSPLVGLSGCGQVAVSAHQVVAVGDFERCVVELRTSEADEEQGVVVDVAVASIATQECAECGAFVECDLVGGDESEVLLVPGFARPEVGHIDHAVAESFHVRRSSAETKR